MQFQITVRYGGRYQRYHTFQVEAENARQAMVDGAQHIPDEIANQTDLVELRVFVDPDARKFVGEDE